MLLKMFRFCLDAKAKFNKIVLEFDLTFSQWQVLKVINSSSTGELTINEIITLVNSDKATISQIVKKLENKKMINIRICENDKRKRYISLSDKMKENCLKLKTIEKDFTNELFASLTDVEKKELAAIYDKLDGSLNESK